MRKVVVIAVATTAAFGAMSSSAAAKAIVLIDKGGVQIQVTSYSSDLKIYQGMATGNVFVRGRVAELLKPGPGCVQGRFRGMTPAESKAIVRCDQSLVDHTGQSQVSYYGGPGNDKFEARATVLQDGFVRGFPLGIEMHGYEGLDDLDGGSARDLIYGGPGRDHVDGSAGPDTIWGGDDVPFGQTVTPVDLDRDDMFTPVPYVAGAYPDSDILSGGDGVDVIAGEFDADLIFGEGDGDALLGGPGRDVLVGGADQDHLSGGADENWIFASEGLARDRRTGIHSSYPTDRDEVICAFADHVQRDVGVDALTPTCAAGQFGEPQTGAANRTCPDYGVTDPRTDPTRRWICHPVPGEMWLGGGF